MAITTPTANRRSETEAAAGFTASRHLAEALQQVLADLVARGAGPGRRAAGRSGVPHPVHPVSSTSRLGRPSTPMAVYLRLTFGKFRYRLGYEALRREVADSITWQWSCRIPCTGRCR